jgi:hypothetical protein
MSDSLADLLASRQFEEPEEIKIIKEYIFAHFQADSHVILRDNQIVISVSNSSLAGALRMKLHELQELCNTKKRLVIRIGR